MRILVSTNTIWTKSGYGNQAAQMIPRLFSLGHEVGLFAWYGLEGGTIRVNVVHQGRIYGLPVYPKHQHGYGNDIVALHATRAFEADIIISLIDAWVLDPGAHSPEGARWCPWFPIDCEPISPAVLDKVKESFQPIVYSRFAERMAQNAGLDVRYAPHGIDCSLFCPGDKAAAREALEWPQDAFIATMVAANKGHPSRKAFPEQIRAFAQLAERHSDAMLYLHTNDGVQADGRPDGYGGLNLPELCRNEEIEDRVLPIDHYGYVMGYSDEQMVNIYRASDVLLSVSRGEGFGIPIVESQATGLPVIVGDWTAMSELCFAGWKVARAESEPDYTLYAADQRTPHISAIAEAMEAAYQGARSPALSERARTGALTYDADHVAETYWRPVLDEIAERMGLPLAQQAAAGETIELAREEVAA